MKPVGNERQLDALHIGIGYVKVWPEKTYLLGWRSPVIPENQCSDHLEENTYYSMYTAWNLGIPLGLERRFDPISRGIDLAMFGYGLTHLWSTSSGWFVQVAEDEKGKKMSFLWSFHNSSATKSSSTRP